MDQTIGGTVKLTQGVNREGSGASHFFLYLLMFLSLLFVALGSGNILFQLINKYFPDVLMDSYAAAFNQSSAKFGIAALFVATPIFYFISHLVAKNMREGNITDNSVVRRWLTWLVLFFASATVLGDLITLIVFFLEGDYTPRFLLKVLTVLLIAGSIFGYYLLDIRRKDALEVRGFRQKAWGAVSAIAVGAVFAAGFTIIDSPAVSREKKQDQQVVAYLMSIDSQVNYYYTENHNLPESLETLTATKYEPRQKINFDAGVAYVKKKETAFELCANFKQSNEQDAPYAYDYGSEWRHAGGRNCFQRGVIRKNTEIPDGNVK